jgi:hypothetical protein
MNRWAVGFFLKKITPHNPHWALKQEFSAAAAPGGGSIAINSKCPMLSQ